MSGHKLRQNMWDHNLGGFPTSSGVWSLMFCRSLWPLMLNTGNPSGVWSLRFCRGLWPLMLNTENPLWSVTLHVLSKFMTTHVEYWEPPLECDHSCSVGVYDHSCWILGPPWSVIPHVLSEFMTTYVEYWESLWPVIPHALSEFVTTHVEYSESPWSVITHVLSEFMTTHVEYPTPLWSVIPHVLSEFVTTHIEYWESPLECDPSCYFGVHDPSCWILQQKA